VILKTKKKLTGFEVAKTLNKGKGRRFADALILEPNISGVGISLKKLFNWGN